MQKRGDSRAPIVVCLLDPLAGSKTGNPKPQVQADKMAAPT